MPPVEGDERRRIMTQMRLDFQDFAMLGDATGALEDGILVLRVDLRPPAESSPAKVEPDTGSGSDAPAAP
jgi:hypothetical protein